MVFFFRKERVMTRRHTIIDRLDHDTRNERRVTVMFPRFILCIDPRAEVEMMTLTAMRDRTGCVLSLADGIKDGSGQPVLIRNHHGGVRQQSWHENPHATIPVYWFLGYMLVQNRWGHIKRVLQLLPTQDRYRIYEQSALEYMGPRRGQLADLIAPLGLVLPPY